MVQIIWPPVYNPVTDSADGVNRSPLPQHVNDNLSGIAVIADAMLVLAGLFRRESLIVSSASGRPIRWIEPENMRLSESPLENNANLMLDEPPLIVRMSLMAFLRE